MSEVTYDWSNVWSMPGCVVFFMGLVCFVVFGMFVQAEHVAEDPGWQVGNDKNYIIGKKLNFCVAPKCKLEA